MTEKIKKFLHTGLYTVLAISAVIMIYRQIRIESIPAAQKSIPHKINLEEIPVPRRPGTQSIRIVGPPQKVLKFELDFTFSPSPLDWKFLERTDKRADIMVEGRIDADGNFGIQRVRDRGHPKAGQYIKNVMSTWKFTRYMEGTIRYYFNVPTRMEHMKVQIDMRGVVRNPKFVERRDKVEIGLIYYIEGIDSNNIMIIN
ncbi:hypothetical protein MJD09_26950 [bacterium]|nr:hypothetical protein [bacterium]